MAERESVPARDFKEVEGIDQKEFKYLTTQYAKAALMERKGKREKDILKVRIMAALACAGIDESSAKEERSLQVGDYRLTMYGGSTAPKIVANLLLKKGVSADIIADCTESSEYAALKISGGELDEDAEEQKEKKEAKRG